MTLIKLFVLLTTRHNKGITRDYCLGQLHKASALVRGSIAAVAVLALLVGCSPYQVDVEQGNILDKKIISQLSLGLSKDGVKTLLGSPVLIDPFDENIWLYACTKQINGGKIDKKKLVLKFKNDKLSSIQ